MQIAHLTAYCVNLPLRKQIKHASASRDSSENIIVCCRLADGVQGWGEGVPRDYVTGETPQGALEQLAGTPLADQLSDDCADWPDVLAMCEKFQPTQFGDDPRGCRSNALRCAVELSILDAFGRVFGEPLSRLAWHVPEAASVRAESERVRYSTAITAETRLKENISALKMRLYGFAQCKVKVGMEGADDASRLRRIRFRLGRKMDIRLDANEAWRAEELVAKVRALLPYDVTCIEQPVPHAEVDALADLRPQLGAPIMLDESLTSFVDAQRAIELGTADLFNLRLSKCGGFVNCLKLAALAQKAGLRYQLGCHPGESGILSAAGRHWACSVGEIRYLEGSYDRHLLHHRLTQEDLTFGYGGWAPALPGPGLGVTVDEAAIAHLALAQQEHPIR